MSILIPKRIVEEQKREQEAPRRWMLGECHEGMSTLTDGIRRLKISGFNFDDLGKSKPLHALAADILVAALNAAITLEVKP